MSERGTGTGTGDGGGTAITTRGTVVIDREACKGCDLCIDACPPRVLVMTTHELNERGYRYPQLLPGCTGCKACSQICPDFVFQVFRYDTPQQVVARAGGAPAGAATTGAAAHDDPTAGDATTGEGGR